ncbi:hypothetical protein RC1_1789 [Rhodospirillum centenum SW]|uniref:Uncharacterized protein n=1 Tax=Rhodospirillum centenum (strain ATCC 51521 / SW) TaxID=414684 RepID=B6ITG7_RHOCS|nr:hypothetical protein RC1_1789 [Rhodospirillum centenum SW]
MTRDRVRAGDGDRAGRSRPPPPSGRVSRRERDQPAFTVA